MNFAGHETFPFRYNWLTKGYARVAANPQALGQLEETMKELGLGKNMARSLRHWMLATGMCEMTDPPRGRRLHPAPLARFLFDEQTGQDRFLEDPGSLWLLHGALCAPAGRATSWFVAFSLFREREFTKKDLITTVEGYARANGSNVARETLERDVDCLIHCYVTAEGKARVPEDALACPLAELGLISRIAAGRDEAFSFSRGPQPSLHEHVFAYFVTEFWRSLHPVAMSLSFDQLAYGTGAPGMVLRLDENSLARRLDALEGLTAGALRFTEGAGVRQLARTKELPSGMGLLAAYYEEAAIAAAEAV